MESKLLAIYQFSKEKSKRLFQWINDLPPFGLVTGLFSIAYLSPHLLPNEEHYLQLAKQYYNPDWIPQSEVLTEFPGTRLLYQMIFGFLLDFFSFEAVVFGGRLFLILAFAHVLSQLYKLLNLKGSAFVLLLHLPILFLHHQSFFAFSWMFLSVEPKAFSFLFILMAVHAFLRQKLWLATFFLVAATYFHILIGFYSAFYLFLNAFLLTRTIEFPRIAIAKASFSYVLLMLPLLIYLQAALTIVPDHSLPTPSANWIYTYFRSPHHTALAPNLTYFLGVHFRGILLAGLALLISIGLFFQSPQKKMRWIIGFTIWSLAGTLILVPVAFIDREGALLKFYLYRINTLSTFFFTLAFAKWLYVLPSSAEKKAIWKMVILLFATYQLLNLAVKNIKSNRTDQALIEACAYLKNQMPPESKVLSFVEHPSITRYSERDRFVVYQFIPAQMDQIPEWYRRLNLRKKAIQNPKVLDSLIATYPIRFLLTESRYEPPDSLSAVFSNRRYVLYDLHLPSTY